MSSAYHHKKYTVGASGLMSEQIPKYAESVPQEISLNRPPPPPAQPQSNLTHSPRSGSNAVPVWTIKHPPMHTPPSTIVTPAISPLESPITSSSPRDNDSQNRKQDSRKP